jgi:protein-tyrosine kinase
MSIVERAIEKGRASGQLPVGHARRPGSPEKQRVSGRDQAAPIDPEARLLALTVTVDSDLCRERRVLLKPADEDKAAVAAYRMLRTRLLHRARSKEWTTIGVTSAGPNDGKTLTTINLALSMAREKNRDVVLLDLDMRNPSVCRTLGVHAPPGELRAYLEKGEGIRNLFLAVGDDNLLVAGNREPTDQASELLASPRFEELLQTIRQGAVSPIILIDLPPVLLTDDALVVAPKVDALLVVASEGLTNRSQLERALQLLTEFNIAGVVFNRAAEVAPGYSYHYEYGYESN